MPRHKGGQHEARAGHNIDETKIAARRRAHLEKRYGRIIKGINDPIKGTRRGSLDHKNKMLRKMTARLIAEMGAVQAGQLSQASIAGPRQ